jgi:hypothetical protein
MDRRIRQTLVWLAPVMLTLLLTQSATTQAPPQHPVYHAPGQASFVELPVVTP